MAQWRKVVVSGSSPEFADATLSGDLTVTGGDIVLGTTSIFSGGDTAQLNNIDALDATTEATIESAIDTLSNLTAASSLVTVSTLGSGAISSGFGNIDIGTSTLNAGNTTVDTLTNDSTVAGSHLTGSFTGSFVGNGSNLTGVGFQIDELSNTLTAVDQADLLVVADVDASNEEKKITFSNFEDEIFGNVSNDILIAAGGVATIQANSVALGTDTTGNYMTDLTAGALIDVTHTPAEGSTGTIAVDLTEAAEGAIADGDYILFLDGGATGTHAKEALADVTTLFAGDGLQAASSVMAVDVSDFAGTGLEDDGSENLRLATQGTGIAGGGGSTLSVAAAQTTITSILNASLGKIGTTASEEYITFGTSNEVNTFIGNSEILSVTANGIDVTGAVTISGNLDVNGTVTTIDSANTYIADKFMIIASGSTSDTDGGILIQNAAGAGYGLGYDSGIDRWVFDADLAHTATDIVPDAYVGVIQTGTTHGDSVAVPTYGGTTNGVGTIYIDTDAGDQGIWIYS